MCCLPWHIICITVNQTELSQLVIPSAHCGFFLLCQKMPVEWAVLQCGLGHFHVHAVERMRSDRSDSKCTFYPSSEPIAQWAALSTDLFSMLFSSAHPQLSGVWRERQGTWRRGERKEVRGERQPEKKRIERLKGKGVDGGPTRTQNKRGDMGSIGDRERSRFKVEWVKMRMKWLRQAEGKH